LRADQADHRGAATGQSIIPPDSGKMLTPVVASQPDPK